MRQGRGDDEEPIFVPIYNYPTPGAFPNRNTFTAPKVNPGFVNRMQQNFSRPNKLARSPSNRTSSESSEKLLTGDSRHDDATRPSSMDRKRKTHDRSSKLSRFRRSPVEPTWNENQEGSTTVDNAKLRESRTEIKANDAHARFEQQYRLYFRDL